MNSFKKEYKTEDYEGELEFVKEGGEICLFLHLYVKNWSKSVLKQAREDLEIILDNAAEQDIQSVSFTVGEDIGTKFHRMIKPLDYEVEKEGVIVGGWFTEA